MTTLQVRIDEKTKKSAQAVLARLGLDLSAAINVYLKQIVIQRGLPLSTITENGLTIQEEMDILQASDEARRGVNVTKPMKAREAIEYLKNL